MTPDSYPSLFWAYNSVWIVLAVYMLWLGVRLTHIEKTLRDKVHSHDEKRGKNSRS